MNLKDFLILIIKNKIYKKTKLDKEIIYYFIELYFRNNISINNIDLLKLYKYFLKKINNTITYNLDEEVIFMEFEEKVLNG
jgi:DNA polymerase-3 subunit delta'